jgi:hypothetical protein
MTMQNAESAPQMQRHLGPPLALLAILYTLLFNAGLYFVTPLAVKSAWPGPSEPASVIVPWFQAHAAAVHTCQFLQLGANVCLGLFTAVVVSRLRFLGVRSAGPWIALFGGFLTVFNGFAASFTAWAMIHPAAAQSPSILLTLYYLAFAFGGPGFSIPMGLLIAGVSVSAGLSRLLPRWVMIFGLVVAAAGELSWFQFVSPAMMFLIPLTRFPGFIWIIIVSFMLPATVRRSALEAA